MLEKKIELIYAKTDDLSRLDLWLARQLPDLSRAKIQRLIEHTKILVNAKKVKPSYQLSPGDQVSVSIEQEAPSPFLMPRPMHLNILYEDSDLLVLNKPAGLTVHPGAGTRGEATLVEGVLHWLGRDAIKDENDLRPGIVHRLDRDTTGVMVYAKNERSQVHLCRQFAAKRVPREYAALLDGYLADSRVEYESYLCRDPKNRQRFTSITEQDFLVRFGKPISERSRGFRWAKSAFVRQHSYQRRLTYASVFLYTGRTHQIRVHSKALGAAVLGDKLYAKAFEGPRTFPPELKEKIAGLRRQMLHARVLEILHPTSGQEMRFEAPLPDDFCEIIELLEPFKD